MFELNGKTALITGSGKGVGFGIAELLAKQGATVVINDLSAEIVETAAQKIRDNGGDALACAFDVTDYETVMAKVAALPSSVDILVNNAGKAGDITMNMQAFKDMEPKDWQAYIDVNLYGVLNCTKAVLGDMYKNQWGRIITISSEAGRLGMNINVSIYGAAKAGAAHFTRHLAVETARQGITCNILSLGLMNNVPQESVDTLSKSIPVGRMGEPMDIAYATNYLVSEEASWVTGATLQISGGSSPT